MAFKFVVLCSVLAFANAGLVGQVTYAAPAVAVSHHQVNPSVDAVASTQQNVVRSFGGTVSTYSKAVDTPYSSVRKSDSRITNNVYTPTVAKTLTYAAPAYTKTVAYAAPAPVVAKTISYAPAPTAAVYAHAAPVLSKTVYTPTVAAPVHYAQPASTVYTHAAPVPTAAVYAHAAPVVAKSLTYAAPAVAKTVTYAAPATTNYNHGSAATTYTHNAPGVSGYGSSQTIHYSPAEMVSHMSFDGFGTHWGF